LVSPVNVSPSLSPEAEVDCTRVARQLVAEQRRVVALMPVGAVGSLHELTCGMAERLADLTGQTAAAVDLAGTWPIWSRREASSAKEFCMGRWLYGARVAALRPVRPPVAGEGLGVTRGIIEHGAMRCACALIDFSGLRATSEHFGAFTLVDGVCLIARAGKTRERELLSLYDEIEPSKNLGVLLISG
jgi:hypothetical protein